MGYNTFKYKFRNLLKLPLSEAIGKINNKISRKVKDKINEKKDLKRHTHIESSLRISNSFIDSKLIDVSKVDLKAATYLLDMYLNHYFDLLGSGFVKIDYNLEPFGIEGIKYDMSPKITEFDCGGEWLSNILLKPHINYSKKLWNQIDSGYDPIDWQIDFKSGYRFDQKKWHKNQPIGKHRGVDIKVPWELMRMQHLLQLSVFAIKFENRRDEIIKEFKNQVLDFLAANPLRMGANWTCTMDVAIRISNILLSYDILRQLDDSDILDDNFHRILSSAAYEHGKFIINNLEWSKTGVIGNHYLSDVAGLLFVSAYLNDSEETNAWLAFAVQEIIDCFNHQFYEDGTNFEASTSYHRLSGELMVYSTALIYGIIKGSKKKALENYDYTLIKRLRPLNKQLYNLETEEFFPKWYLERISKISDFTEVITKGNGNIVQIGDNDSGRFIKLTPCGEFITLKEAKDKYLNLINYNYGLEDEFYWDENLLNHDSFISAAKGLINTNNHDKKYSLEKSFVESLSKAYKIKVNKYDNLETINMEKYFCKKLAYNQETIISFLNYGLKDIALEKLKVYHYENFGLTIIKSDEFFLSFMTGGIGQDGNGGHAHNDKLSFELNVHGYDLFLDAGTYLYTPIVERRNQFRSVISHNAPIVEGEEQGSFTTAFSLKSDVRCEIINLNNTKIKAYMVYKDTEMIREISIYVDKIIINDYCNKKFKVNFNKNYSNGYGKLLKNN